ncbi:methyltransferase domain-containing protein [Streptomyces chrestomyceticus]|uniref:methyltransferase domain-containing protein n=1 Tax=Streptomyces chrestomyceticus TaxID=68185 RepID=UPI0033FE8EC2
MTTTKAAPESPGSPPGPLDAAELRRRCAATIDSYGPGHFEGRPWLRQAFLDTPREHFVPDRYWSTARREGRFPVLDRAERPHAWLKRIYRPLAPLITQIALGEIRPEDGPTDCGDFTSSISCPAAVVGMLHHLDPRPGDRILEIGTGSGYNAALLAHRVGATALVTVDIDAALADGAASKLAQLGLTPTVVTGDGELGYEQAAPFDGILSTAAVREIPQAWLRQVRPGGVIVTPVDTPFNCDGLCRLVCDGEGGATGRMVGGLDFMKVRGQRARRPYSELGWPLWSDYHVTAGPGGQRIRTP